MNEPRVYIVILGGIVIGASLIASTLRRMPQFDYGRATGAHLHRLDAVARLVLGVSLALEVIFLFFGVTLWTGKPEAATPGWAAPAGLMILSACLLSAVVAGLFALTRRFSIGSR